MKISGAPRVIISPHNQAAPKGRAFVPDDNEINDLELTETKYAKLESWICRNIGKVLSAAYPNREWRVETDLGASVLVIQIPLLSTEKGYVIHMVGRTMHDLQARALQAAGEILERYGLSRNRKFDPDNIEAVNRHNVKIDEAIGPDSRAESIDGRRRVLKDGER